MMVTKKDLQYPYHILKFRYQWLDIEKAVDSPPTYGTGKHFFFFIYIENEGSFTHQKLCFQGSAAKKNSQKCFWGSLLTRIMLTISYTGEDGIKVEESKPAEREVHA